MGVFGLLLFLIVGVFKAPLSTIGAQDIKQ